MPLFMNPVDTPSLSIYTRNRIFLPMRSWMSLRQKQSNLQLPWLHDPKTGYQGTTTGNNEISAPNPRKEKILIEQKIILLFFFFSHIHICMHTQSLPCLYKRLAYDTIIELLSSSFAHTWCRRLLMSCFEYFHTHLITISQVTVLLQGGRALSSCHTADSRTEACNNILVLAAVTRAMAWVLLAQVWPLENAFRKVAPQITQSIKLMLCWLELKFWVKQNKSLGFRICIPCQIAFIKIRVIRIFFSLVWMKL